MTDLIQILSEAAARGVDVVVMTGGGGELPCLRFPWTQEDKWWGAVARYRAAGFSLAVSDLDGDRSIWALKRNGKILAEGEEHGCRPYYHFDACLLAAEAALLAEVQRRKESLRSRKAKAP
jgi:hypothetical protein